MLSAEEMCRLQTFPRDFVINGTRRIAQHQIGNAVPPALAELLGREIRQQLLGEAVSGSKLSLIPAARDGCPPPERATSVPKRYLPLMGDHKAHPGEGKGPGRRQAAHDDIASGAL
jgi:DNA (cytosine-5)-methyltransferase 1